MGRGCVSDGDVVWRCEGDGADGCGAGGGEEGGGDMVRGGGGGGVERKGGVASKRGRGGC